MPGLLTVIAHPIGSGRRHQCALDDVVGIVIDIQVSGEVGAEIIDDSLQGGCVRRCGWPASHGAGGLLVAERIVC